MTGRWALLAGLVGFGALAALAPARYPYWLDTVVCLMGGLIAAWAVLHVAHLRERRPGHERPKDQN
ncbi:hypothetical protein [Kitasatospora acidiphila]|uniref:hypothetical protein n=1 Tax=Kitasatospora acidiphila TaxID=2567942 RepID=UPI003C770831